MFVAACVVVGLCAAVAFVMRGVPAYASGLLWCGFPMLALRWRCERALPWRPYGEPDVLADARTAIMGALDNFTGLAAAAYVFLLPILVTRDEDLRGCLMAGASLTVISFGAVATSAPKSFRRPAIIAPVIFATLTAFVSAKRIASVGDVFGAAFPWVAGAAVVLLVLWGVFINVRDRLRERSEREATRDAPPATDFPP